MLNILVGRTMSWWDKQLSRIQGSGYVIVLLGLRALSMLQFVYLHFLQQLFIEMMNNTP